MFDSADIAAQFEKHIGSPKQTWLLGAGVSYASNIPLMHALTNRVLAIAKSDKLMGDQNAQKIIEFITNDISETSNIEDFLTHLGDLISMAERSRIGSVTMNGESVYKDKLVLVHGVLLGLIADTIRWGYREATLGDDGKVVAPEQIGEKGKSIVALNEHTEFVRSIFSSVRAGLEVVRSPVEFFTTNYDTLLEDALALNKIRYLDGFWGGGVGFWSRVNYERNSFAQAIVTKLHGSIDWHRQHEGEAHLFRVREGDTYPSDGGVVMIYPQATKYANTQRDPFAELFQRFRHRLENGVDQVLLVCGYSFGDEHINAEIEIALRAPKSQLTVIAFVDEPGGKMPSIVESWRNSQQWGNQVFVAGSRGLYQGKVGPLFARAEAERDWWTFSGVARLLSHGLPSDVLEVMQ